MYFIDVQGTLISDSDKSPINGACELLKKLNQKQIPYVVITNNTKISDISISKLDEFPKDLNSLLLKTPSNNLNIEQKNIKKSVKTLT